jgi:hypothetical protein
MKFPTSPWAGQRGPTRWFVELLEMLHFAGNSGRKRDGVPTSQKLVRLLIFPRQWDIMIDSGEMHAVMINIS